MPLAARTAVTAVPTCRYRVAVTMSSPVRPVADTKLRGGNTDCALALMSELASLMRSTPAAPMEADASVALTVGACVPEPDETVQDALATVSPYPVATAVSERSVTPL